MPHLAVTQASHGEIVRIDQAPPVFLLGNIMTKEIELSEKDENLVWEIVWDLEQAVKKIEQSFFHTLERTGVSKDIHNRVHQIYLARK